MAVLLILESLGSTELFFILAMALVFFGPRKLPQLSRTLGKNLASFRRASEDFKRTWDREVTLEEMVDLGDEPASNSNSILGDANNGQSLKPPTIQPIAPDRVIARETINEAPIAAAAENVEPPNSEQQPAPKREWL